MQFAGIRRQTNFIGALVALDQLYGSRERFE